MILRIETVSGSVYYLKDSFLLYGAGRVIERLLEMKDATPEAHYGLVFDKAYNGIGSKSLGFIPISQIVRLTIQDKRDEAMELEEKIEGGFNKRRQSK